MSMSIGRYAGAVRQAISQRPTTHDPSQALASGRRINRAADDAAGLAISTRLESSINAWQQVQRNINDGISYLQVAEQGVSTIQQTIQRMHELAVASSSGSYSSDDRKAFDQEFQQLKSHIDVVTERCELFGHYPLYEQADTNYEQWNPPESLADDVESVLELFTTLGNWQSGYTSGIIPFSSIIRGSVDVAIEMNGYSADDDIQLFDRYGHHLAGTPLGDRVWDSNGITNLSAMNNQFITTSNSFFEGASYDSSLLNSGQFSLYPDMHIGYSGDDDTDNDGTIDTGTYEQLTVDRAEVDMLLFVVGSGVFQIRLNSGDYIPYEDDGLLISPDDLLAEPVPADALRITREYTPIDPDDDYLAIRKTPTSTNALNIASTDLLTADGSEKAITQMLKSIDQLNVYQAYYGSLLNRFATSHSMANQQEIALQQSHSRITDADMASSVVAQVWQQVLQQSELMILSQANVADRQVMTLLQN